VSATIFTLRVHFRTAFQKQIVQNGQQLPFGRVHTAPAGAGDVVGYLDRGLRVPSSFTAVHEVKWIGDRFC
jgi:hypothetical protein